MKYNKLGQAGLNVSIIGLGMEHLTAPENIAPVVHRAIDRGIGLVAMKTFGGGGLFQREEPLSPNKCLSCTLPQPGVAAVLVEAGPLEELETDLRFLEARDEAEDFSAIIEDFQKGLEGRCVYCSHCLACPSEIDIAVIIRILTTAQYNTSYHLRADYEVLPVKACDCIGCGDCMECCPFGVDVILKMEQTVEFF